MSGEKKKFKTKVRSIIPIDEAVPYVILAAIKEPLSIFSLDITYNERKKSSKITIKLYNTLLLILILFVFVLILFSGGITIGQMSPPPVFIGNIYGLPVKAEFFTVSADGTFFASLRVPIYNKSLLYGRISISDVNFVPVSNKFICTPNKYNNNIFAYPSIDKNMENGFIFPLNQRPPSKNERIFSVELITLLTEDQELRQLEFALGRYGEAESKLGVWLQPGKSEFNLAIRGTVDFKKANEALIDSFGSKCTNGVMKHFVVRIMLDFNTKYFLGVIKAVKQDIGYVLFPACNL
ncbi:hypothetical protein FG386_002929 [Cryptosporidium ryanae]|uniref:uncharacterized protein n=1 Tax=Cryptosporidium ryanae TaxID=515981 RepID=UPI00351A67E8|nr:hypothetical protein FG386_002929 [Cryptosporidium ryanae]